MIISERSLEAADEKLKEIVLDQSEEIESGFVDHLIRKFVFGAKIDEPVNFHRFRKMMRNHNWVLLKPSLIRQEYLFYIGRRNPDLFDAHALAGLGTESSSYRSSGESIS